MKLVSFRIDGSDRYGVVTADGIVDATARVEGTATLRDVLEQGKLGALRRLGGGADYGIDDVEYALPITEPRKILCAGRNYRAYHEVVEQRRAPEFPSIFARFATSFSAHRQAILKPKAGAELDYEGELVVVIGKRGRHIPEASAFDYIAGYTCMNEGTVRDWMDKGTQNTPAKNFDRSGGLGPWIVTADAIPDPSDLRITTRRNGELVQDAGTDLMIFSIPYLVAHVSKFTLLEPGDLIATGSPGGSAIQSPSPSWLRPGEDVEVEIAGVGTLQNPIASE